MFASYFKTFTFSLQKISLYLQSYTLQFRSFCSQSSSFCNTLTPKLTTNDSRIIRYVSKLRKREAWSLLDKMPDRSRRESVVHWTSVLTRYSKNGFIDEAMLLFEIMPERNIVTYNAMLSGLVQCGRLSEARRFFEEMPERNVVSWTSMLCGLADTGRICEARKLFEEMPERNIVSWNSMIVGLIRNGDLEEARRVFDDMPVKNVVSLNAMIAGYAQNCRIEDARVLFEEMEERNVVTWTSMVSGYCREGEVDKALILFRRMPERNVVSWTAMIGGFTWNEFYEEALFLFLEMMRKDNIKPNGETFTSLAYACAGIGFPCLGKQLHAQVIVDGWEYDDYDGRLSRSLIHMYSMFGVMDPARYLFNKNSNNFIVQSCNALINGYIRTGRLEEAQYLFDMVAVRDKISWTSMIDGYLSAGQISKACYLFASMPERDAVAWTVMISGYVQNESFAEAIYLFLQMRTCGVTPLNSTYSVLLGAAGATANLDQGMQLHGMLIKTQFAFDLILENSLVSMYAKCGVIEDACSIFSNMVSRDLISWNSMIMGFSYHGRANQALMVFEAMLASGTRPNSVTFLGVLSACSHAGLVSKGWELFNGMSIIYGVQPGSEHYICMINLLGRAGRVKEAEEFITRLPFEPDRAILGALLGVCGFSKSNVEIGKRTAKRLLELDPLNAPAHVVLCNMYAANGEHAEEQKLRKDMGFKGVRKVPGCSWMLVSGQVHVFLSGDKSHRQTGAILWLLFGIVDESYEGSELFGL